MCLSFTKIGKGDLHDVAYHPFPIQNHIIIKTKEIKVLQPKPTMAKQKKILKKRKKKKEKKKQQV